jgi:hypothetical protein
MKTSISGKQKKRIARIKKRIARKKIGKKTLPGDVVKIIHEFMRPFRTINLQPVYPCEPVIVRTIVLVSQTVRLSCEDRYIRYVG